MGTMQAMGYSEAIKEGWATLETALAAHLQSNHFPAVSPVFVPVAIEAIAHGNEGEWDQVVQMPNGMAKTAGEIVEGLHLEAFLGLEDDED